MECQVTTKNLKINKNKAIGTIIIVVEGESDEFYLLKHIFTKVFHYNYISYKRTKTIKHEFVSLENPNNHVIVANTNSSSIKSIINDKDYKDKLYYLLKSEFKKNLKNTPIYIIWDRDKDEKTDKGIEEQYKIALECFANSMDNDYDMNGILLLNYPCHESYILSNFSKTEWKEKYYTSKECKRKSNMALCSINDINDKTLITAVTNMHRRMVSYNITNYDTSNFKKTNETIYRKEEECFKNNKYFDSLSLISIMLIDLGLITEI